MDKKIVIKGKMTSIKNYLLNLGAKFYKNSDKSPSIYLKFNGDKIRISDHVSVLSPNDGLNIVVPFNDISSTIVSLNGTTLVFRKMSELKSFLNTWACITECMLYSKESMINSSILKKTYELNCLHESVVKEKNHLTNISRNIEAQQKILDKLKKTNEFSLNGLTDKQVKQITQLVDTYRSNNKH